MQWVGIGTIKQKYNDLQCVETPNTLIRIHLTVVEVPLPLPTGYAPITSFSNGSGSWGSQNVEIFGSLVTGSWRNTSLIVSFLEHLHNDALYGKK